MHNCLTYCEMYDNFPGYIRAVGKQIKQKANRIMPKSVEKNEGNFERNKQY